MAPTSSLPKFCNLHDCFVLEQESVLVSFFFFFISLTLPPLCSSLSDDHNHLCVCLLLFSSLLHGHHHRHQHSGHHTPKKKNDTNFNFFFKAKKIFDVVYPACAKVGVAQALPNTQTPPHPSGNPAPSMETPSSTPLLPPPSPSSMRGADPEKKKNLSSSSLGEV